MSQQNYQCDNCSRIIGNLEQPYQWGQHVVCSQCCALLQSATPADPLASLANASIYSAAAPRARRRVTTVEQTGKVWKAQMLLSTLLATAGTVALVVAIAARDRLDVVLQTAGMSQVNAAMIFMGAAGTIVAGIAWFIFARVGAWWFHG